MEKPFCFNPTVDSPMSLYRRRRSILLRSSLAGSSFSLLHIQINIKPQMQNKQKTNQLKPLLFLRIYHRVHTHIPRWSLLLLLDRKKEKKLRRCNFNYSLWWQNLSKIPNRLDPQRFDSLNLDLDVAKYSKTEVQVRYMIIDNFWPRTPKYLGLFSRGSPRWRIIVDKVANNTRYFQTRKV